MKDDRIFLETRLVLVIVIPFLLLAFVILYLNPSQSGERFAWEIKPNMTALFIGAGYLGGAYQFVHAVFGRRWHRIAAAFPPVTAFTICMLLATLLHWERFDINHFPFQLWLVLYIVTPFLVPYLWMRNRVTDPGTPEPDDIEAPPFARLGLTIYGALAGLLALFMILYPAGGVALWPWTLTPLTARIMGGWLALISVGSLAIARDTRWSAWRVAVQSILFWAALVLVGAFQNPADFKSPLVYSLFTIGTAGGILVVLAFHIWMEIQRRPATARLA